MQQRRDLDHPRRAAADAHALEHRPQPAADASAMGVAEYDFRNGQLLYSDSFLRLLGREDGAAAGPSTFDWFLSHVHEDDRVSVRGAFETVAEQGEASGELAYRVTRSDGALRWWSGRVRVIRDEAGAPSRAIGVVADVTERRQIEEEARRAHRLEAMGQLAGGIAHDFNNLLTVITGYAETLLTSLGAPDPRSGDVIEIRRAAERARMLTQQLLAFSHKQVLQPEIVDVGAVVSDLAPVIARLVGRSIELRVDIGPGAATVLADRGQIEQVLLNLAANARDAMPFGGTLEVRTDIIPVFESPAGDAPALSPGAHVLLAVRDSGSGMTADVRARAFEPFFTTKEMGRGTGLGLATVHGIVTRAGGEVQIDSEAGRGTLVTVSLPLTSVAEEPAAARPSPPEPTNVAGVAVLTVLLVEDYRRVRDLAQKVLAREGYHVLAAASGPDALALCRDFADRIDLVITDVVMSPMSGPELAQRIEAARPGTPILYMSGYTGDMLSAHGVAEDGISFIEKPFTPAALARKVRDVLAKSARQPARPR